VLRIISPSLLPCCSRQTRGTSIQYLFSAANTPTKCARVTAWPSAYMHASGVLSKLEQARGSRLHVARQLPLHGSFPSGAEAGNLLLPCRPCAEHLRYHQACSPCPLLPARLRCSQCLLLPRLQKPGGAPRVLPRVRAGRARPSPFSLGFPPSTAWQEAQTPLLPVPVAQKDDGTHHGTHHGTLEEDTRGHDVSKDEKDEQDEKTNPHQTIVSQCHAHIDTQCAQDPAHSVFLWRMEHTTLAAAWD